MKLNDEDKVGLSPDEIAALEAELSEDETKLAAIADGRSTVGDDGDEDDDKPAAAADDEAASKDDEDGAAAAAEAVAAAAGDEGAAAAADQDVAAPVSEPPFAAALPVADVADYEKQRGSLLDERKDIRQKYRDGEIDVDAYEEQLDAVNDKIASLDRLKDQADFAKSSNENIQRAQWFWTVGQFKKEIKSTEGIDYDANPTLMKSWDEKVKALGNDEANNDKPAEWFLQEAHRQVVAEVRSVAEKLGAKFEVKGEVKPEIKKTPEAVKKAVEERRPDTKQAKSLATVPTAEGAIESENAFSHLDGLSGLELERAVARLSPEDQDRWARG